jgi:zinc/manganese transport system substrate-binding protein
MLTYLTRQVYIRLRLGRPLLLLPLVLSTLAATPASATARHPSQIVVAIGAENEYANVIGQIGGKFVKVSSILNNPNTDPHTFESSPSVAREVSAAQLIVQNGLGYDDFMNKIEAASPSSERKVVVVQSVLDLPDSTPNPHLWYSPTTMPAVAKKIAADLAILRPSDAHYFQANLMAFDQSLTPWLRAINAFKTRYAGTPVATTEPVADYLLQAMGVRNLTPFDMQADIMNGVDPSPQNISLQDGLFAKRTVKVFVYNQQVVDSLTTSFRAAAGKAKVPVVGVYETMPAPGYDYQTWMLAEVEAIQKAIADGESTGRL